MNKHYICSVNFDISCAEKSLQSRIVRCCPALRFNNHFVGVNEMVQYFRDLSYSGKQTDPSQSPPGVGNVAPQYHLKPYEFRIQYPPFKALNFVPIG